MAAAVDTRHPSALPPASPAKSTVTGTQISRAANPLALDIPVIATGARPGESGAQRELFTEETSTALVIENGGVIRLSAAVVPGQLLFLTNKETRREVVAQVMRKRDFRPTSCYVELEFSEPSPGFWGVEFPEIRPNLSPTNCPQEKAATLLQATKIIGKEPRVPAPAHGAQQVAELKQQVEALRNQVKLKQAKPATENSATPAAPPDPQHAITQAPVSTPVLPAELAPSEPSQKLTTAVPEPTVPAPGPHASSSLPIDRDEPSSSEKELLAKRLLASRGSLASVRPSAKSRQSAPKPGRSGALRSGVLRKGLFLAASLLIAASAAWYENWIPWPAQLKRFSAASAPSVAAHPAPAVSPAWRKTPDAPSVSATTPPGVVSVSQPVTGTQTAPPQPSAALPDAANSEPAPPAQPSKATSPEPLTHSDAPIDSAPRQEKSIASAPVAKPTAPRQLTETASVSKLPASGQAAIVPPKLIKSVRAIAPWAW